MGLFDDIAAAEEKKAKPKKKQKRKKDSSAFTKGTQESIDLTLKHGDELKEKLDSYKKPKKKQPTLPPPESQETEPEEPDQTVEDIPKPKRGRRKQKRTNSDIDYDDLDELIQESQKAAMMKPILDNKLKERKIEQETLELKKRAGEVMEFGFGDFVFFSHIERIHIEIARLGKKLRPLLDGPVKERDLPEVVRLIEKECASILTDVKKGQIEAVKSWEEDL